MPSTEKVRERLTNDHPELVEAGLNLMFTQLPDGSLTIGDTHHYSRTVDPYRPEDLDDLVLTETARLLGVPSFGCSNAGAASTRRPPNPS